MFKSTKIEMINEYITMTNLIFPIDSLQCQSNIMLQFYKVASRYELQVNRHIFLNMRACAESMRACADFSLGATVDRLTYCILPTAN